MGPTETEEGPRPPYVLRLFVAGSGPRSVRAIERTLDICQTHLDGRYELEIVDVHQAPERLRANDIVAIPTLLREQPAPLRNIIGDLADEGHVLAALGLVRVPGLT